MNELAINPIQQFGYTTGKNSTDASMIIDAMDLLYSEKFDAFALVSSDSDFTKLASRLRESEMFVFGVGEKKHLFHSGMHVMTSFSQKIYLKIKMILMKMRV